jgi:hypothetical protein
MTDVPDDKAQARRDATRELLTLMGLTLVTWQRIEDAHYLFFLKMLGAPKEEICSVLYFSPPSFESRRVMVDRVAHYFLEDKVHRKEWKEINKELETCAAQRGRVSHYGLGFEIIWKPSTEFEIGAPRLEPSIHDKVQVLRGRTTQKPEHRVTKEEMMAYMKHFEEIEERLINITKAVSLPVPQLGANFLQVLQPFLETPKESPPIPPSTSPSDDPPSEK